jgi:hydroxyacylglutathione hydrolase
MILQGLVVGPYGTNCYIVGSESSKKGMVIDPGAEGSHILKVINQLGLSISLIVVTHVHTDHVGALAAVKQATGAPFALHEAEWGVAMQSFAQIVGGLMSGSLNKPYRPDRLLKEDDVIEVGDLRFSVLHTPGHSPGGISLYGSGVVFSGDTLFNSGIGRTDFPGCSYDQIIDSIKNKLFSLPDDTVVYPGHGTETTIGEEKRSNPFVRGSLL